MMKLVNFLLSLILAFRLAEVSCDSCSLATFYIKPSNGSNSECPTDCPCITLDQLAVNKLPNRRNTDSITLILLDGVHNSTISLSFVQIKHVIVTSQNTVNLWAVVETPPTLIQLLSSNISIVDVTTLEIKNLAIDASGRGVLIVQKHSDSWSISFHKIMMLGIIVQIQPLSIDATAVVTITSSLFKISRIEIKLCVWRIGSELYEKCYNAAIHAPY